MCNNIRAFLGLELVEGLEAGSAVAGAAEAGELAAGIGGLGEAAEVAELGELGEGAALAEEGAVAEEGGLLSTVKEHPVAAGLLAITGLGAISPKTRSKIVSGVGIFVIVAGGAFLAITLLSN